MESTALCYKAIEATSLHQVGGEKNESSRQAWSQEQDQQEETEKKDSYD
jgi:hypothetical protein